MNEEQEQELWDKAWANAKDEAWAEYQRFKQQKMEQQEREECEHDEHEGGYCIECGENIMDDLIGRAELLEDR